MVIVGCVTLSTSVAGFPAIKNFVPDDKANSFSFTGCASGGVSGHIRTWVCPGEGCQSSFCALKSPDMQIKQTAKIKRFIPISTVDGIVPRRLQLWLQRSSTTSIASLACMDYPPRRARRVPGVEPGIPEANQDGAGRGGIN